jgi:hypothetical protein
MGHIMVDGAEQEYSPYRNRLLEVEPEYSDEANDIGNKHFITIIGIGAVAAVLLATILSIFW